MKAENICISSSVVIRNKSAIHDGTVFFESRNGDELFFLKELYRQLKCDYPKFYKMDNLCKLAFAATELLMQNRSLPYPKDNVALVFSNAGASLDTDKTYYASVEDKSNYFPSPAVFVYTLPNIMMGEICIRQQFQGENAFFVSENFDAELLVDYCRSLLLSGKAQCAIAGWVEINETAWEAAIFLIESGIKEDAKALLTPEALKGIYGSEKRRSH